MRGAHARAGACTYLCACPCVRSCVGVCACMRVCASAPQARVAWLAGLLQGGLRVCRGLPVSLIKRLCPPHTASPKHFRGCERAKAKVGSCGRCRFCFAATGLGRCPQEAPVVHPWSPVRPLNTFRACPLHLPPVPFHPFSMLATCFFDAAPPSFHACQPGVCWLCKGSPSRGACALGASGPGSS